MNDTLSFEQKSKACILEANLMLRQYKIKLLSRFMEIKSVNTQISQDQKAKKLDY